MQLIIYTDVVLRVVSGKQIQYIYNVNNRLPEAY